MSTPTLRLVVSGWVRANRARLVLATVALVGVALALWVARDALRPSQALYREAREAPTDRASRLYGAIARRMPEIEEYCQLWSAQAGLPSVWAVAQLHQVALYRPDSPAAHEAWLALARYYASIESFDTVDAYEAALGVDDRVAVRLELARYLEEQNAPGSAYKQYVAMLGRAQRDAFAGMRRVGVDPVTVAQDLLDALYVTDALEALGGADGCEAVCLRAEILRRLGESGSAAEAQQACDSCQPESAGAETPEPDDAQPPVARPFSCADALAAWESTWHLEEAGKLGEAVAAYLRVASCDVYVSDDAAYRAWVLSRRMGDTAAEAEALVALSGLQPNWLAYRATGEVALEVTAPYPPGALSMLTNGILGKVQALESLGRHDLAHDELRLMAQVSETPEVVYQMARELALRGDLVESCAAARSHLYANPWAPAEFWQLAYPRPYEEHVERWAEAYGVDPWLVWSVMRQESTYDTEALSGAGARGLMQMMPSTQREVCDDLDIPFVPGDAYRPDLAIRMGCYHLEQLMEITGSSLHAIMAYNAGWGAVQEWLEDPLIADEDDLLRFAWYGQTREYAERVNRNMLIYRALYE